MYLPYVDAERVALQILDEKHPYFKGECQNNIDRWNGIIKPPSF